jgi:hypothetical protein
MLRDLHFFGECRPGRNSDTFEQEVALHREFLRALDKPDVRDGETLPSLAERTYQAWISGPFSSRGPAVRRTLRPSPTS